MAVSETTQPQVTYSTDFMMFEHVAFEIRERTDRNRHTDKLYRRIYRNSLHPYRWQTKYAQYK